MYHYFRGGRLAILMALALVSLTGCQETRDTVLMPAIDNLWSSVAQDVRSGLGLGNLDVGSREAAEARMAEWDQVIERKDRERLRELRDRDWGAFEGWAWAGIEARIHKGELTEGTAGSLHERVRQLHALLTLLDSDALELEE
jgi:hypothetical protein